MTLYLLFEQFEAKKLTLESELSMSEHCASRAPTKLGIEPGGTIWSEDAIKALVTRSANDVACAIGETIGGNEESFAALMTRKAHAIGMSRTVYRNASGLPDDEQVTTARDQATLGRAIQDRFPRYYRYFSTLSFTWHGHAIRNHNHLVGSMEGVDGIKTGFVTASGFNLISSMRRNGHHLVAVVMGGSSAGARDSRMRDLLGEYVNKSSTRRTAPLIAEGHPPAVIAAAGAKPEADVSIATTSTPPFVASSAPVAQASAPSPQPAVVRVEQGRTTVQAKVTAISTAVGSNDDIRPIHVKTVRVRAATLRTAPIGGSRAPVAAEPAAPPATEAAPAPQPEPSIPVAAAAPPANAPAPAPVAAVAQPPAPRPIAAAPAPAPAPVVAVAAPAPVGAPAPASAPAARAVALAAASPADASVSNNKAASEPAQVAAPPAHVASVAPTASPPRDQIADPRMICKRYAMAGSFKWVRLKP